MSRTHPGDASWHAAGGQTVPPVSTAPGFVAIVDVAAEIEHWRRHYDAPALAAVFPPARFVDLEPAIRVGIHAFLMAPDGSFEALAQRLSHTYRRIRGASCLSWYLAKAPCAEAYARLQHAVTQPARARPAHEGRESTSAGTAMRTRPRRVATMPRPTLRPSPAPVPDTATSPRRAPHPPERELAATRRDAPAANGDASMPLPAGAPRQATGAHHPGARH